MDWKIVMPIANISGKGTLYILSAPSGAGKTTIAEAVIDKVDNLGRSVSYTTRKMRDNEVEGEHYHFIDETAFKKMVEESAFLEHAFVHGGWYGTAFSTIKEAKESETDILLVIDVQGAKEIRKKDVDQVSIFLLPPSLEELKRRLILRGTECCDSMNTRLEIADEEMSHSVDYDYTIVNNDLETAKKTFEEIIIKERGNRE